MEELLIVTDTQDRQIGVMEKLEVHRKGLLHRAFSVFLFRGDEMLIQKRARAKYHSGGLWANTCCSHPRSGEPLREAVRRRLKEEAGIQCSVEELCSFIYRAEFANGLCEYEIDHVFVGEYDGAFHPNPEEAETMRYVSIDRLERELLQNPQKFAPWFLTAAPMAIAEYRRYQSQKRRQEAAQTGHEVLTAREREVAALAKQRMSIREIAEELYISPATVKNILHAIYGKLNVSGKNELKKKNI